MRRLAALHCGHALAPKWPSWPPQLHHTTAHAAIRPPSAVQYLADMHAVHAALESSIAGAAAQVSASSLAGLPQQRREQLLQALGLFGAARGLDRAAPLLQDLRRLAARQQQQEASRGGGGGAAQGEYSPPPAMQHAAAYAAYLASLARACRASEGPDELEQVGRGQRHLAANWCAAQAARGVHMMYVLPLT